MFDLDKKMKCAFVNKPRIHFYTNLFAYSLGISVGTIVSGIPIKIVYLYIKTRQDDSAGLTISSLHLIVFFVGCEQNGKYLYFLVFVIFSLSNI
jgi:hypothetical protein